MKKFSVIIASMLFFAGMTIAQQNQKVNQPTAKTAGGSTSTSGTTSGTTGTVKKVPATKGKATPAAKATATPGATGK